jgi:epoxyqueuosine reductase
VKETIRRMALSAGFVRPRVLAPFEPGAAAHRGFDSPVLPEGYRGGAPALLVAALPYGNQGEAAPGEAGGPGAAGMGIIAPFARRNYYREAVDRLRGLGGEMRRRLGGKKSDYRVLCNSPVPEKTLALAAGLGSLGRNGLVITGEAGSLFIIAAMTLPLALDGDGPEAGFSRGSFPRCAGCDRTLPPCAAACPTGAVRGDGTLDLTRCIQWYASGKEEEVPWEVRQKWGRRLYGCSCCQDACVYNRRPIRGVETLRGPLPAAVDLRELLAQTDEEIAARFKGTALGLSWLGARGIRRNARLALG